MSDNARYCLVRLILRTSNRWYPVSTLKSYKKEIGEDQLTTALKDLCSTFTIETAREIDVKVSSELPEIDVVFKQEDLSVGIYDEDDKSNFASAIPLTGTVTSNFFDGLWHQGAGMSQLPQSANPIRSLLSSDISTITMDSFCQNESVMTTREILDSINKDQLVALAKEMKCKLRPNSKA